jgi:hypothetical protein
MTTDCMSRTVHHPFLSSFCFYKPDCDTWCQKGCLWILTPDAFGTAATVSTLVGIIPGLGGAPAAIASIGLGIKLLSFHRKEADSTAAGMITKGILQFIGLGVLVALVSAIITAVRHCFPPPTEGSIKRAANNAKDVIDDVAHNLEDAVTEATKIAHEAKKKVGGILGNN